MTLWRIYPMAGLDYVTRSEAIHTAEAQICDPQAGHTFATICL